MHLTEIGINMKNWIDSAQDRGTWRILVNVALKLKVPYAMGLVNPCSSSLHKIKHTNFSPYFITCFIYLFIYLLEQLEYWRKYRARNHELLRKNNASENSVTEWWIQVKWGLLTRRRVTTCHATTRHSAVSSRIIHFE